MAGGLMNLFAVSSQSAIIYGNPEKTYWVSTYKKISNFGMQNFRLDYEGLRQLQLTTDTIYNFKVRRYAELLMDTTLVIQLPDIYSPLYASTTWVPYKFKWIQNLGAFLIRTIRITVGGALLQEITGYDMVALASRDLAHGMKRKWDSMTGNVPELNDPANAYGRKNTYPNAVYSSTGAEPSIRGRTLYIPIPIWWSLTTQQAFPLVSLQYNELQIEVTLRPLQELFQIQDVTTIPYPVVAPNFNLKEHQFYRFIQTPPIAGEEYPSTSTSWNENVYISSTYCFISDEERRTFALQPQKYLIHELHDTWFYDISSTDKAWLQNSTGLVTTWMMLFQRSDVNLRNEWSNFTNWEYNYLPQNVSPLPLMIDSSPYEVSFQYNYNGIPLTIEPGTLGYGLNPDGTPTNLYGTGSYASINQKDIPLTIGILLDGNVREEPREANLYKYQQQYIFNPGSAYTVLDGLYCYNFSLDTSPFKLQPSGAMNMCRFTRIELNFTTMAPLIDPNAEYYVICDPELNRQIGVVKPNFQLYVYTYNLLVIEERYNMLTFIGGNVGMMNAR